MNVSCFHEIFIKYQIFQYLSNVMPKVESRMVVGIQSGCLCIVDSPSDGELLGTVVASAQHHKRVLYHMSLVWEKVKTQSIVSTDREILPQHHNAGSSQLRDHISCSMCCRCELMVPLSLLLYVTQVSYPCFPLTTD